jgi:dolichol-phosphate mannosyltransferase
MDSSTTGHRTVNPGNDSGAEAGEVHPSAPGLALVIPTLRESRNIRPLLARVRAALDPCNRAYEVIVVDDSSGDGTAEIVSELAREDPRIRLIVRCGERGLAGAVLCGWRESGAEILAVMDADLQHPPELLPNLLAALDAGADLAVGSRYIAGDSMRNWRRTRRTISRIAVWMTLPVQRPGLRADDPMSGFFMLRRSCIERVELQKTGFKILLEILARAEIRSIAEIPFQFGHRQAGASKAGLRVAFDYAGLLFRLYRQKGRGNAHPGGDGAVGLRNSEEAATG